MGKSESKLIDDVDEHSNETSNPELHDLDKMVKAWVLEKYLCRPNSRNPLKKLWSPDLKEIEVVIDYNGLQIDHAKPDYSECEKSKKCQKLASTTFNNSSGAEQKHKFITCKSKAYTYKYNIERAMTVQNIITKLTLSLPEEVLDDKPEYEKAILVNDIEGSKVSGEQEIKMEHMVSVPPYSQLTASLLVEEKQFSAWFTVRSTITGTVRILLRQHKHQTSIKEYPSESIADIVRFNMSKPHHHHDSDTSPPVAILTDSGQQSEEFTMIDSPPSTGGDGRLFWDVGRNVVCFQSKGYCHFEYMVSQKMSTEVTEAHGDDDS